MTLIAKEHGMACWNSSLLFRRVWFFVRLQIYVVYRKGVHLT